MPACRELTAKLPRFSVHLLYSCSRPVMSVITMKGLEVRLKSLENKRSYHTKCILIQVSGICLIQDLATICYSTLQIFEKLKDLVKIK